MTDLDLEDTLASARIVPVLGVTTLEAGLVAAERLVEAGATVIEIVMRSAPAVNVIRTLRDRHPGVVTAAGTVLTPARYDEAVAAGAQFAVSPGLEPILARHAAAGPIRLVPGVQTASEVMAAMSFGFTLLKYYPAEPTNGATILADFAHVFPGVRFMPTGKIGPASLPAYTRLPNVPCVGGSWMYGSVSDPKSATDMRDLLEAGRRAFEADDGGSR